MSPHTATDLAPAIDFAATTELAPVAADPLDAGLVRRALRLAPGDLVHPLVDASADLTTLLAVEASPDDPAALAALAGALAVAANGWPGLAAWTAAPPEPVSQRRAWLDGDGICLLRTGAVEVRLVRWEPGRGTSGHDHGGASGALAVVEGELVEDRFPPGRRHLSGLRRRLRPGAPVTLPADHAHVLANPGPLVATSVHAVSPPWLPARPRSVGGAILFAEAFGLHGVS